MSQCEIQVSKLPSFAFALAQVVVNISSRVSCFVIIEFYGFAKASTHYIHKYLFTELQFLGFLEVNVEST